MPSLSKIFKPGKKVQGTSQVPELQQANFGTSQPSSSTVWSGSSSSSWNSHVSQGNVGGATRESLHTNFAGPTRESLNTNGGRPMRESLHSVPEKADSVRIPAEMEGWSNPNRASMPAHPSQSPNFRRNDQWQHDFQQNDFRQNDLQQNNFRRNDFRQNTYVPFVEEEIQMSQAVHANDSIARRKAAADAEKKMFEREQNASADTVRRLREMVRERYALDIFVWSKRDVLKGNRKMIVPKCKKADHILQQIYFIVNAWEEDSFNEEEWELVEKIKACLLNKQLENGESNEPAYWESLPPWERLDEIDAMDRFHM